MHEEKDILMYIENFYRDLFTSSHVEGTNNSFESFIENLETPKLQDNERDKLEGEILWWPMGAITKSTIFFRFLLYILVFCTYFIVFIDLIC